MDRNFIKILIEKGTPFSELSKESALIVLNNNITEVYIKNGLHRTMTEDKFNEEVKFNAVSLYAEIMNDKAYSQIRDEEMHYIFSEAMKGRLGTDKDIVITFKSLLRWIEGYLKHQEYREAVRLWNDEHRPKAPELPQHIMTDDEYKQSIRQAYDEYVAYRAKLEERSKAVESGRRRSAYDFKTIGEAIGPPIGLSDYGGYRMSWLVRNGYAKSSEKLVDVFTRAMANNGKFLKLNK